VNVLVYRANARLQQHPRTPSISRAWCYKINEKGEVKMLKRTERKFFIVYSLYAWCFPLVLLVVSVVFDLVPIIPSSYLKPNFGETKCWFSSK
jgi:hypothetical protein